MTTTELWHYPLAPLTSWHIGGEAERFFSPQDIHQLSDYLKQLPPEVACTWLGLGSNVLIADEGVKGSVITLKQLQDCTIELDGSVRVEAGMTCAKFARFCCKMGFPEAAFFAGIPGTLGGALAMNAGAFGGETWEWVEGVWIINRQGETIFRQAKEYQIGYRTVKSLMQEKEGFIAGLFRFPFNKQIEGAEKIRALLRQRNQSQPIGTYNCGSVYRNPEGDHAARLIEACQLKGYAVGGALVSPKHANFIINQGNATATDVLALMKVIESCVKDKFGIQLMREVKMLGFEQNA